MEIGNQLLRLYVHIGGIGSMLLNHMYASNVRGQGTRPNPSEDFS